MTKIAFASCMNGLRSSSQKVWKYAAAHQPDWLMLCGDNIYMDYFPDMYQSRHWSPEQFAAEMQYRYMEQFSHPAFRNLIGTIPEGQVLGVWDDHDFAWNNCYGSDPSFDMPVKKKIAAALFHHYFSELNKRPLAQELPPLPIPDLNSPPNGTKPIYRALDIGPFRTLICDGRTWRRDNSPGTTDGSVLGDDQEAWLLQEIENSQGPLMIVSGSTMTNGDDQSWDYFQDFFLDRFLPAVSDKLVLFVAGDVHENRLPPRIESQPIEIVSSAAVLGFPFNKRNYGLIELEASTALINLFRRGKPQYSAELDLVSGEYFTTMVLLTEEYADLEAELDVEAASDQRKKAQRELEQLKTRLQCSDFR